LGKGKEYEMKESPQNVNITSLGDEKIQDIGATLKNTIVATKRRIFVCGNAENRLIGNHVCWDRFLTSKKIN